MGAWGHAVFDNDAALDWLADAASRGAAVVAAGAFEAADGDYLDVDAGSSLIAAAALVAAALDGDETDLPPSARALLQDGRAVADLANLGAQAAAGLRRVLLPSSELASLWKSGQEGDAWRASIERLIARLRAR